MLISCRRFLEPRGRIVAPSANGASCSKSPCTQMCRLVARPMLVQVLFHTSPTPGYLLLISTAQFPVYTDSCTLSNKRTFSWGAGGVWCFESYKLMMLMAPGETCWNNTVFSYSWCTSSAEYIDYLKTYISYIFLLNHRAILLFLVVGWCHEACFPHCSTLILQSTSLNPYFWASSIYKHGHKRMQGSCDTLTIQHHWCSVNARAFLPELFWTSENAPSPRTLGPGIVRWIERRSRVSEGLRSAIPVPHWSSDPRNPSQPSVPNDLHQLSTIPKSAFCADFPFSTFSRGFNTICQTSDGHLMDVKLRTVRELLWGVHVVTE